MLKMVNIWRSYGQEYSDCLFLTNSVYWVGFQQCDAIMRRHRQRIGRWFQRKWRQHGLAVDWQDGRTRWHEVNPLTVPAVTSQRLLQVPVQK